MEKPFCGVSAQFRRLVSEGAIGVRAASVSSSMKGRADGELCPMGSCHEGGLCLRGATFRGMKIPLFLPSNLCAWVRSLRAGLGALKGALQVGPPLPGCVLAPPFKAQTDQVNKETISDCSSTCRLVIHRLQSLENIKLRSVRKEAVGFLQRTLNTEFPQGCSAKSAFTSDPTPRTTALPSQPKAPKDTHSVFLFRCLGRGEGPKPS